MMVLSHKDSDRSQIDTVSLRQSTFQRTRAPKYIKQSAPSLLISEKIDDDTPIEHFEEDEEEIVEKSKVRQRAPSSEISEENWNEELFQFLQILDPRQGDQLFEQYQAEKASYVAEVDLLLADKEKFKNEEIVQDIDESLEQLHERYQSRLQEVFGNHYESFKTFEREFQIKPSQD